MQRRRPQKKRGVSVRFRETEFSLVDRAAELQEEFTSSYIREAAVEKAERDIRRAERLETQ